MRFKYPFIFKFSLLLLISTSCNSDEDYIFNETKIYENSRSVTAESLIYPMSSFITSINLTTSEQLVVEEILEEMQTRLGDGYNPLFYKLKQSPIAKISVGSATAPGTYNPTTNAIVLKSGETILPNVLHEELIHAGQDRIYPGGIAQYVAKTGTPNIEFECKLTQDLINCIVGGDFTLGAGPTNQVEYVQWVLTLCGDDIEPQFPTMNTVLTTKTDNDGYYQMMEAFKTKASSYNYPIISTLKPLYINYINSTYGLYN